MNRINCRTDPELEAALEAYRIRNNLNRSQAVRELLRQILTDADDLTRGWQEGFAAGYGEAQEALQRAAADARTG